MQIGEYGPVLSRGRIGMMCLLYFGIKANPVEPLPPAGTSIPFDVEPSQRREPARLLISNSLSQSCGKIPFSSNYTMTIGRDGTAIENGTIYSPTIRHGYDPKAK